MAGWSCLYYRTKEENVILNLPQNVQEIKKIKKAPKNTEKIEENVSFWETKQKKLWCRKPEEKRCFLAGLPISPTTKKKKQNAKKKRKRKKRRRRLLQRLAKKLTPFSTPRPRPPPPSPRSWERFCFPNIGRTRKTTKPVNTDKLQR